MKNKSKGGKGPAPKTLMNKNSNDDPIQNAVATLVKAQLSSLLQGSPAAVPRPRLQSKRRMSDSEGEAEEEEMERNKIGSEKPVNTPAAKKSRSMESRADQENNPNVQVVLLEGVHDNLKSNPKKFLTAL